MFIYRQSTGEMIYGDTPLGIGYSGFGQGKDNPAMQNIHNVGPIPEGFWRIGPLEDRPQDLGPVVMPLTPEEETETFGRSEFWIHGDSQSHPGLASHGCIILARSIRQFIADSSDDLLEVLP